MGIAVFFLRVTRDLFLGEDLPVPGHPFRICFPVGLVLAPFNFTPHTRLAGV